MDSAAWPTTMISWSKLTFAADWINYNIFAERSPMDLTCGKAINSTKTAASIHSVIISKASLVIAAKSREPMGLV